MDSDKPDWWLPRAWPKFWQRMFLLTLPISGPLWVASFIVYVGILMVAVVIGGVFFGALRLKETLWD